MGCTSAKSYSNQQSSYKQHQSAQQTEKPKQIQSVKQIDENKQQKQVKQNIEKNIDYNQENLRNSQLRQSDNLQNEIKIVVNSDGSSFSQAFEGSEESEQFEIPRRNKLLTINEAPSLESKSQHTHSHPRNKLGSIGTKGKISNKSSNNQKYQSNVDAIGDSDIQPPFEMHQQSINQMANKFTNQQTEQDQSSPPINMVNVAKQQDKGYNQQILRQQIRDNFKRFSEILEEDSIKNPNADSSFQFKYRQDSDIDLEGFQQETQEQYERNQERKSKQQQQK